MTQLHDIRKLYYEEGRSISEIARQTGHDRKTVRACIDKEDWNVQSKDTAGEPAFPKLEPFKEKIDEWLTEDKKAKRKQRHTALRVYDRLRDEYPNSFNCSYRTVAGYVAGKKGEIFGKKPGYLPLEHIPGEAQVDFGKAEYYENERRYYGYYLNLSFPFSNNGYLQLFRGENQECLLEGMTTIFEHIGGVPARLWFDNPSTMVTKVLKEGERKLTDGFLRFIDHYRFEAAFCSVQSGWEKGNVENKVGYHRRNMLVPVPRFRSLFEFNKDLLKQCDLKAERAHYRKDATIRELYEKDKAALLNMPPVPLDVSKYVTMKTNGYGKFCLHKGMHEYSVSPKFAKSRVLIRITANEVIPLDESHREIIRHSRLYGDHKQQSMEWIPYLAQLSRCPAALKYTGIYQLMPEELRKYLEKCSKSQTGKVLRVITMLTAKSGFESAIKTVGVALLYDAVDIDSLINLHTRVNDPVVEMKPIPLNRNVPELAQVNPNLKAYDVGLKRVGDERW